MARINRATAPIHTHGGAKATRIDAVLQLRRSVMSCMLWEKEFYEDGKTIAQRIEELVPQVAPATVAQIAIAARNDMHLRHVPLLLVAALAKCKDRGTGLVAYALSEVIQRPDELTEFLAIYWRNGKCSLSGQVKKGLARAFSKFSAYSLAKYNRDEAIKLRDVLFLCHAKPKDGVQAEVWQQLVNGTLATPDTWEVALSAGTTPKKDNWERLLREHKLGGLALLRNLRNMVEAGVSGELIAEGFNHADMSRVLPFRFVAAAKAAPRLEPLIDAVFLKALSQAPKLSGKTVVVIDVSGSMYGGHLSAKSDMSRAHVACALVAITREICADPHIYATAGSDSRRVHKTAEVPARRGMALVDAVYRMCEPLGGGGIFVNQVCAYIQALEHTADRLIIITDEQDCDMGKAVNPDLSWVGQTYMINVASAKNGVGYHKWVHIDGWSEAVLDFIRMSESGEWRR